LLNKLKDVKSEYTGMYNVFKEKTDKLERYLNESHNDLNRKLESSVDLKKNNVVFI
jgi:hypothetical protein